MKTPSQKTLALCALLALLLAAVPMLVRGMAGTNTGTDPFSTGGGWESRLVNRVNLAADKTQFVFIHDGSNRYRLSFTLTAEKTEPDFYAQLDALELLGFSFERMLLTAHESNGAAVALDGAVLPVGKDGLPQALRWTVVVEFTADTQEMLSFTPTLRLSYTAGTRYALRDSYCADIPLAIKICDLAPLPTVLANAEKLFAYDLYTEESLQTLRALLDTINRALQSPGEITTEQINTWVQAVSDTIDALVLQ